MVAVVIYSSMGHKFVLAILLYSILEKKIENYENLMIRA
jgi:hypothetical protein